MSGSIGDFGTRDPNAAFVQPGTAVPGVDSTGAASTTDKSTIEKSEAAAAALLFSAGFPFLSPPQESSPANNISAVGALSVTKAQMDMDQTKNQIISSMWDSFLKNVREMSQRAKEEDAKKWIQDIDQNGPKSGAEYQAFLMALSSSQRADEINGGNSNSLAVQVNQTMNNWLVSPSAKVEGTDPSAYPSTQFVAGAMASNPDVVRNAIGAVGAAAGVQLSVSPVADAMLAVGPTSGLPADYQSAAALVASLLNGGAVNKANQETIEQAAGGGQPVRDLDFALNYAKNIKNIITHNAEKNQPQDNQQSQQNKMMRIMLASMALVMVYRTQYGSITGAEFASMVNSTATNLTPEIKSTVQDLVALLNKDLPSNQAARDGIVSNLMAYAEKNQSIDSMLATTRSLSSQLKAGVAHNLFVSNTR